MSWGLHLGSLFVLLIREDFWVSKLVFIVFKNVYVIMVIYMDPSRNNTFGGSDSDERNPSIDGGRPTSEQLNSAQSVYVRPVSTQSAHTKQALQQVLQKPVSQQPTSQQPVPGQSASQQFASGQFIQRQPVDNVVPLMNPNNSQLVFTNVGAGGAASGTNSKKKMKLWIILIAVLVILVLGIILWLLIQKNSEGVFDVGDIKASFNSYVNYVIHGEDSSEAVDIDSIQESNPYYMNLEGVDLQQYLAKSEEKYNAFANNYNSSNGDVYGIQYMNAFFYDYVEIYSMSIDGFYDLYRNDNIEAFDEMLSKKYDTSSNYDAVLRSYIVNEKQLAGLSFEILSDAEKADCLNNGGLIEGCYTMSDQQAEKLTNLLVEIDDEEELLYENAIVTINAVFTELYGNKSEGKA